MIDPSDVPLRDAIQNLSRQLALEVSFDPGLSTNDSTLSQEIWRHFQSAKKMKIDLGFRRTAAAYG
jgi:hypothetical protein